MSKEQSTLELYLILSKLDTKESRETIAGVQEYLEAKQLSYGRVVSEKQVTFYLRKESA